MWAPDDGVRTVLVVAAHPDDIDFGAAGSVAALTASGCAVTYCIVTDGQAGGFDRSQSRLAVGARRRKEQSAAAAEVGVQQVVFLGYPDGALTPSLELRRDLTRVIRQVRPQRVIAPSPERDWSRIFASHPDHLATGEAVICAVYPDSRNPFAHPELLDTEGLEPHTVEQLWLMASSRLDLVVDITSTFDRKIAALSCHESQLPNGKPPVERLYEWAAGTARMAGLPEGSLAEGFQTVRTA